MPRWTLARPTAKSTLTTSRREELKNICYAIYLEACNRIDDPKNVAKGDAWTQMTWDDLKTGWYKESDEFEDAIDNVEREPGHDPLHEAGDTLVRMAQIMDKKGAEVVT